MDEDQNHSHEHHDHASHGHSAPAPSQPEPGKAIDPVCGMQVTIKPDARHRDYGGDTFYPALFAEPARRRAGGGLKPFLPASWHQVVADESYASRFG